MARRAGIGAVPLLACLALTTASCAGDHAEQRSASAESTAAAAGAAGEAEPEILNLVFNTQATLDDVRIGAGNFWEGDYVTAGGGKATGPTAGLWISVRDDPAADRHLRVGPGSRFSAGRLSFEVLEVTGDTVRIRYRRASQGDSK